VNLIINVTYTTHTMPIVFMYLYALSRCADTVVYYSNIHNIHEHLNLLAISGTGPSTVLVLHIKYKLPAEELRGQRLEIRLHRLASAPQQSDEVSRQWGHIACHQRVCDTRGALTSRTPHAVAVVLQIGGEVVIDNVLKSFDMNAPRGHIRAHKSVDFSLKKNRKVSRRRVSQEKEVIIEMISEKIGIPYKITNNWDIVHRA
jgi:hypothetical protein